MVSGGDPDFATAIPCESIPASVQAATEFIQASVYHGFGNTNIKFDKNGKPKLIEVNPRIGASLLTTQGQDWWLTSMIRKLYLKTATVPFATADSLRDLQDREHASNARMFGNVVHGGYIHPGHGRGEAMAVDETQFRER